MADNNNGEESPEDGNFLESIRNSSFYGPVGIILAAFVWYILKKITDKIPCIDAPQLRRTLLALMFSGVYVYTWIQGVNPHDAEIKENTMADELPLLLAAGFYLSHISSRTFPGSVAHHAFSVMSIWVVIRFKGAGEAANTFGFLVEAPQVFYALRGCVRKIGSRTINAIVGELYLFIFVMAKFVALGYHAYLLVKDEKLNLPLKICTCVLASFSFSFIWELIFKLMNRDGSGSGVGGTKLKSRSRSRNRQRSRSRSKPYRRKIT